MSYSCLYLFPQHLAQSLVRRLMFVAAQIKE